MLNHTELVSLEKTLRDVTVLSVYVNGAIADVAARGKWRTELRNALDAIEASLAGASHAEKEAFAATRRRVEESVDGFAPGQDAPGWMGFFTADAVHHAGVVPVAVPTMATWTTGASVTPSLRVLKESRPMLVVVADSSAARIYRYADRSISLVDSIEREAHVDTPYHMGRPAPQGFSSGTRGRTGTDAAQRELRKATETLVADLGSRVEKLAGDDAWVVIGGIPVVAAALRTRLGQPLAARSILVPLDVHATEPVLAEAAREAASGLRAQQDLESVEQIVAATAEHGLGAVGLENIDRALLNGQVRELYLTSAFLRDHPQEAEAAIRSAFDEGAIVEHVSGEGALKLDSAGGIGARLRFAIANAESVSGAV
jgi:hypothetical protein